jgi:hypothetical protein
VDASAPWAESESIDRASFGGDGPERTGCIECGGCMLGCRHNAKNTLPKNYLWFAERLGVKIIPERTVSELRPLGAPDGSDGYAVTSERTGAWIRKDEHTGRTRGSYRGPRAPRVGAHGVGCRVTRFRRVTSPRT